MENHKILSKLSIRTLFTQLLFLGFGFLYFVILYFTQPDYFELILKRVSEISFFYDNALFLMLFFAYIIGRALNLISELWIAIIRFILKNDKKNKIKNFGDNLQKLINNENFPVEGDFKKTITEIEMVEAIHSHPLIEEKYHNLIIEITFIELILGLLFFMLPIGSPLLIFILITFFTYFLHYKDVQRIEYKGDVALAILKIKSDKSSKNN